MSPRTPNSALTPNSVLSTLRIPHQLSLSGGNNHEALFTRARNIQQYHFRYNNTVLSFDPASQSLIFFVYPGYQDANSVWRPVHANQLAALRAFAGEYHETVLFTMSPAANADLGNPGKLALRCSTAQPGLGIFGCKFFVPIEELTNNGALGNTLAAFNPATVATHTSSPRFTPSPVLSSSSSSLLHALDEVLWSSGTSKRKHEFESNDGSPKKSRSQAQPSTQSDIEDFSPPHWGVLSSKKAVAQDVMFKESFLCKISLRGTSTMEEFFQGAAALPTETLQTLQGRYTSGEGITLSEYKQITALCLECGKVFSKLVHTLKPIPHRKTAKGGSVKKEKGKGKERATYVPDIFTSTPLAIETIEILDSEDTAMFHETNNPLFSAITRYLRLFHLTWTRPLLDMLPVIGPYHYAVQYDYSPEQQVWLADQGPTFEKAIQSNRILLYLERVYSRWFNRWPTESEAINPTRANLDKKQRKIELFSLYIMGLKHRWLDAGTPPDGWTNAMVYTKLEHLEDMIQDYWGIQCVFVQIVGPANGN
ncbi:uncharacterized protein EV420DRAFT_1487185 [Desarmillaria tabescens]|uniref:Uncharacterized protein n=1 Tax=Armillaria tabescens TaxID=1929756 RepID=A0AA39MKQ2_ARMTA|nr:uncharacterized protein EV420DRAFT_1487185 [Desarmillaria tabescens]KAK0437284.1 hypothetical protein EV420DRAFT_1487185 [Desarmillaria tabescens]